MAYLTSDQLQVMSRSLPLLRQAVLNTKELLDKNQKALGKTPEFYAADEALADMIGMSYLFEKVSKDSQSRSVVVSLPYIWFTERLKKMSPLEAVDHFKNVLQKFPAADIQDVQEKILNPLQQFEAAIPEEMSKPLFAHMLEIAKNPPDFLSNPGAMPIRITASQEIAK